MEGAKSNTAAEEFNYKEAITKEDERIGLRARQKKVVAKIMEDLKNNEEGGQETMKVKGGVKTKVATKKVVKVVPPKVNLETVRLQALSYLEEVEKVADFDNIKYELEKVNIGILNFKQNSRLIFGIRYRVCGDQITYSLVARETFKNFNKELQGKYQPGNWNILFDLNNSDDIKRFSPIIEASIEKLKKAEPPKAKVKK